MQFADFVTCGFNQIVNNLAKQHYRWSANANVVIRMPAGGGMAAGPFHSQSNEAWFTLTPGLKVVYPSNPHDAKGLLLAAFEDPNPVMYFEHKGLYRLISESIPDDSFTVEIGKATVTAQGDDCTIITYGMGVHWAKEAALHTGLSIEILDLRTLLPLDYDAIHAAVKKTGRVLILHEDNMIGGLAGEISAYALEVHWMHEAALSTMDAIIAATGNAARALGWDSWVGTLEAGKVADLIIHEKNPLENLHILADKESLRFVLKDGLIVASHLEDENSAPKELFAQNLLRVG